MLDLPALQKLLEPLFPGLMGVRITEAAPDRVVAEMPVHADLCTAGGILHGGATMAFADTLGAIGTLLNLAAGKRTKNLWVAVTAVAAVLGFVFVFNVLGFLSILAIVAAGFYLADVRPALRRVTGRGTGSHQGPYGPW